MALPCCTTACSLAAATACSCLLAGCCYFTIRSCILAAVSCYEFNRCRPRLLPPQWSSTRERSCPSF